MAVLVITHSDCDSGVAAVMDRIRELGGIVYRLDGDRFPMDARLATELTRTGLSNRLVSSEGEIDLSTVDAAWFHQTAVGYCIPALDDARHRELAVATSLVTLQGILASMDVLLVDPFGHAELKPVQLRAAQRVGLDIPRTLVTSDPDSVRRFAAEVGGRIVMKTPGTNLRMYDERGHADAQMYTQLLEPDDLAALDGLQMCPMIFQEPIEKKLELRIVVVGYEVFAAAIDPTTWTGTQDGSVDWRQAHDYDYERTTYELPAPIRARILALTDTLGVNFAAIDMIVTPAGEHVFLEANPNGGGFEPLHRHGLPIANALAELLLGTARHRSPAPAHLFLPTGRTSNQAP